MFGFNFNPTYFLGFLLGFVIGTTFHEFMHAYTALVLGDNLAQRQGRVTLNPAAHFDPWGFGMGLLLALGVPAIAWGRPVPVNTYALRFGRRGMALVAFAGPLSNLVFAAALTPLARFTQGILPSDVREVILYMVFINLLLFVFNLIPIPPLDGFNILTGILPNPWTLILEPLRRQGLPILITLIFFLPFAGRMIGIDLNPVGAALSPVRAVLERVFLGI